MAQKIHSVCNMMRRALNTLDYQLMDHGERVAYLLLHLYRADGGYTDEQLLKICHLGIFHDIGAYQTEMLDSLRQGAHNFDFEVANTLSHAIYGYVFLKRHDFFAEFSEGVLFHHFPYPRLQASDCGDKKLAARMFLADRIDVMVIKGYAKTVEDVMRFLKNPVFDPDAVALMQQLEAREGVLTNMLAGRYLDKLYGFLNGLSVHDDQMRALLMMLPGAIDFRSEHTVTHTAATVEISLALAQMMGLDDDLCDSVHLGAMLHDIGKIAVSPMILEKTSGLSANEFAVMKDHVLLSEHILRDCVSDEVLQIAIRHHEKLDGTGYPKGLGAAQLSTAERIVAVADILSALTGKRSYKEPFPKQKVIDIIAEMADTQKICPQVAQVAIAHYDEIAARTARVSEEMEAGYRDFRTQTKQLYDRYSE